MFKNLEAAKRYTIVTQESNDELVTSSLSISNITEHVLTFTTDSGSVYHIALQRYIQTTIVNSEKVRQILLDLAKFKNHNTRNLKLIYILASLDGSTKYIFEEPPKHDLKNLILGEKYFVVTKGLGGNHHSFKGVLMGRKDGLLFEGNGTLVIRYNSIERLIIHEDDSVLSPLLLPQIGVNEESFNNPVYEFLVDGKYIMVLKRGKQIEVQKLTVK